MKKFTPLFLAFFAAMQMNAATFTAATNGNWDVGTTWGGGCSSGCVAGVDYPSLNDNVIIPNGKTVTIPGVFTQAKAFKLTINVGGKLNMIWNVSIYHDLVNNGTMTGVGATYFFNPNHNISGSGLVWPTGDWHFKGSRTILAGTVISRSTGFNVIYSGITVTNNGTLTLGLDLKGINGTSVYKNGATGTTTCRGVVLAIGVLDCGTAGNTFIYGKTGSTQNIKVPLTTYHHLTINSTGTKMLTGNTVVNGNFLYSQSTFSMAGFNFSVGGNWTNNANLNVTNMATVTFTGTGNISRTGANEVFNNLTFNATGTHTLAKAIQVNGNVIITTGTFDVSASNFAITARGNWTKNGGTFNGRNGTVTFNNVNHTIGGTSSTTFGNLTLNQSGTATLGVNTAMTGDFNYLSGLVNCATFNLTIGGGWNNTANTTLSNMGTVTFNGAGLQNIIRTATEHFNNLTISASSIVAPGEDIIASGTITVSSGTFDVTPSNFAINTKDYTQTGGIFLAQGGTLTLTGNFSHSAGTFTAGTGTVLFNGIAAQTIGGAAVTVFNNMTLSNAAGVSLTAAKNLSNTMTLTAGNFNTGGFDFTLLSTVASSARIAALPVASTLLGNSYVIQRDIHGGVAAFWDFLGAPAFGSTLARWDNVTSPTPFFMSGINGNDGCAGSPCYKSVRRFNEPTGTFQDVNSSAQGLNLGKGFMIWVASDMVNLSSDLIFDTKGTVSSGTQSIAVTKSVGNGFNIISNPMPSQILWSTILASSSNLNSTFRIYDESLGNYATYDNASGIGTGQLAGSGGVINTTQGFMIQATANTNVIVTEASKTASLTGFVRMADPLNLIKIRLSNNVNTYGAENAITFVDGGNDNADNADAGFFASPTEEAPSLKIMTADHIAMQNSSVNAGAASHEIPLVVKGALAGTYTLSFTGIVNFNEYNCIYLQDQKTGKVTNLKNKDSFSFVIEDPAVEHEFVLYMDNERSAENNYSCRFEMTALTDNGVNVFNSEQGINITFDLPSSTPVTIEIYNALGELVVPAAKTEVSNNTVVVGEGLSKGLYMIHISTADQTVIKKLIRQ